MYRLLREIKETAMQGSMTGALRKGSRILVRTYNRIVESLAERNAGEVRDFFPPLPEDANIDEVGVAAALLSGYLRPEPKAKTYTVAVDPAANLDVDA